MAGGVKIRKRNRSHVDWNPHEAEEAARSGTVLGSRAAAKAVLRTADPITPYETGELKDSAFVNDDGKGLAIVGYQAAHAAKQHENPEYSFRGSGEGKWLETAVKQSRPSLLKAMAAEVRGRFR